MIPDWQLPTGVDRGLHDYLRSGEMVRGYDDMMEASPLARLDIAFCEKHWPKPGRIVDLGCGTGRVARYFGPKGFDVVGLDLSEEMLAVARQQPGVFIRCNIAEAIPLPNAPYDYGCCLFSTLGMVRGEANRQRVLKNAFDALKPGGIFVLHGHNRGFAGLKSKPDRAGDVRQPQAYGGAELALTHFTRKELEARLVEAGFAIVEVMPVGLDGPLCQPWWLPGRRAYGFLVAAVKPRQ